MATHWRSPPDKVPTACSGSRSRMPIRCISAIVTWFACRMSKRLNGPQPLVGSRPMKKLRVTDISGIIARSWNTVAMPAFMAWRGLSSTTSAPLTSMVPPEGLCTPDMVLMKVDLPAPLSPSRQWHSPAWMENETPDRAMMLPKRFSIARISTNGWGWGWGWAAAVISALPGHALADGVVEQHGHQQHRAQENQVPVLIDAGVGQPYHHHPEDDRAQESAHGRAVATGEQAAANHGGNDGLDLLLETAPRVRRSAVQHRDDGHQPGAQCGKDKQAGLDVAHHHPRVLGGRGIAAGGKNPVAQRGAQQHPGGQCGQTHEPADFHREPGEQRHAVRETRDQPIPPHEGEPAGKRLAVEQPEQGAVLDRFGHAAQLRRAAGGPFEPHQAQAA